MKRFLQLLCALAFCLALTPATALAADEFELYVSGQQITQSGCYENQNGTWTKVDGAEPAAGQFCYDAVNSTLTLNGTTISHNQNVAVGSGTLYPGSLIAYSQSADVPLHLVLQGDNSITGTGGIRVMSDAGDVSLSISGPGSLTADVGGYIDSGITLFGSKDANLNIDGADVTASSNVYGVQLQAGEGYVATATINDGNLTASGSTVGIYYSRPFGGTTGGPSSLTVSGNAVVDTEGSIKGILNSPLNSFQVGADGESGGIVWDGNTGTVYGDVTLQDDLTINENETLTIGTDASLTIPDGKTLTNNGTITNDGTINIQDGGTVSGAPIGGTIVSAPTITKQPESQTVAENATATFTVEATGGNLSYQWQQSTDNGQNWTDINGANSDTYTTKTSPDMNGRQYRCKMSNNAGSVTSNAATLTVNQHKHQWGEPAWTWSEDGKTATATFTCAECDETQNVEATVTSAVTTDPTCTENGVTEYTATVKHDGTTYTATKNVADIPATGHEWGEDGHCTICDTVKPGFTPEIIQGDKATWTKGDGQPLSFTSNAAYADFQEARVDGQPLDPVHYTVERGSTIVTLKAAYLVSVNNGECAG